MCNIINDTDIYEHYEENEEHKANTLPFFKCTRYSRCSVNLCPLDPVYPDGFVHPDDIEQKCTLPKSYRLKVAAEFPGVLKYRGLTLREFNGKKTWESKTPEEREKITSLLKKNGFAPVIQSKVCTVGVVGCTDSIVIGKRAKPDLFYDDRSDRESKYEFW